MNQLLLNRSNNPLTDSVLPGCSSFYAKTINTSHEIRIYTGVNSGNQNSGILRHTQSGSLARAGYHTIRLSQPISLNSGQRFSVVVKFNTPGGVWPVPVECAFDDYSSAASAFPGESFMSHNGTHDWFDISQAWGVNVCIKAFTEVATAPLPPSPPTLVSPANGASVVGTFNRVTFQWDPSSGATYYNIQVYSVSYEQVIINETIGNQTFMSVKLYLPIKEIVIIGGFSNGMKKAVGAIRLSNGLLKMARHCRLPVMMLTS